MKFYTYPEGHHTSYFKLIEERIVPEPTNGDSFGLLRSAELDVECMLCYLRLQKETESKRKRWICYDKPQSWRFLEGENVKIRYDSKNLEKSFIKRTFQYAPLFQYGALFQYGGKRNRCFGLY